MSTENPSSQVDPALSETPGRPPARRGTIPWWLALAVLLLVGGAMSYGAYLWLTREEQRGGLQLVEVEKPGPVEARRGSYRVRADPYRLEVTKPASAKERRRMLLSYGDPDGFLERGDRELRRLHSRILARPEVAKALKITDEQRKKLGALNLLDGTYPLPPEHAAKLEPACAAYEAVAGAAGPPRREAENALAAAVAQVGKETTAWAKQALSAQVQQVKAILTPEQIEAYRAMAAARGQAQTRPARPERPSAPPATRPARPSTRPAAPATRPAPRPAPSAATRPAAAPVAPAAPAPPATRPG